MLGLVLLEAAACGTPAVALRGTAAADLISQYGSGIVVDDFGEGLFQFLHDVARSEQFEQMRVRAKVMAADHDISVGTTILVNTWLDACHVAKNTTACSSSGTDRLDVATVQRPIDIGHDIPQGVLDHQ